MKTFKMSQKGKQSVRREPGGAAAHRGGAWGRREEGGEKNGKGEKKACSWNKRFQTSADTFKLLTCSPFPFKISLLYFKNLIQSKIFLGTWNSGIPNNKIYVIWSLYEEKKNTWVYFFPPLLKPSLFRSFQDKNPHYILLNHSLHDTKNGYQALKKLQVHKF